MQKDAPTIKLRTKETDFSNDFLDTEKLIQVITALTPKDVRLPSAVKRHSQTPETIYRVYAYRHRSRCLKDFAEVMDNPTEWEEAKRVFLELATDAWRTFT